MSGAGNREMARGERAGEGRDDERQIERLILREARLLDDWQLDEWLTLFTTDGIYWVPIDATRDPRTTASIIYDNGIRRTLRVEQAMREKRAAQTPRSRTVHVYGNLEVDVNYDDTATARCSLLLVETRAGDWRQAGMGVKNLLAGHVHFRLQRVDGVWKFAEKRIDLIDRNLPIEGLSYLI